MNRLFQSFRALTLKMKSSCSARSLRTHLRLYLMVFLRKTVNFFVACRRLLGLPMLNNKMAVRQLADSKSSVERLTIELRFNV